MEGVSVYPKYYVLQQQLTKSVIRLNVLRVDVALNAKVLKEFRPGFSQGLNHA